MGFFGKARTSREEVSKEDQQNVSDEDFARDQETQETQEAQSDEASNKTAATQEENVSTAFLIQRVTELEAKLQQQQALEAARHEDTETVLDWTDAHLETVLEDPSKLRDLMSTALRKQEERILSRVDSQIQQSQSRMTAEQQFFQSNPDLRQHADIIRVLGDSFTPATYSSIPVLEQFENYVRTQLNKPRKQVQQTAFADVPGTKTRPEQEKKEPQQTLFEKLMGA